MLPNTILALNKWPKINEKFAKLAKLPQIWSHWRLSILKGRVILIVFSATLSIRLTQKTKK